MLIIYVNAVSNGLKLPHLNSVWPDRVISATIFEWTECDLNKHATTDEYYYTVVYSKTLTVRDLNLSQSSNTSLFSKW